MDETKQPEALRLALGAQVTDPALPAPLLVKLQAQVHIS